MDQHTCTMDIIVVEETLASTTRQEQRAFVEHCTKLVPRVARAWVATTTDPGTHTAAPWGDVPPPLATGMPPPMPPPAGDLVEEEQCKLAPTQLSSLECALFAHSLPICIMYSTKHCFQNELDILATSECWGALGLATHTPRFLRRAASYWLPLMLAHKTADLVIKFHGTVLARMSPCFHQPGVVIDIHVDLADLVQLARTHRRATSSMFGSPIGTKAALLLGALAVGGACLFSFNKGVTRAIRQFGLNECNCSK